MKQLMQFIIDKNDPDIIDGVLRNAKMYLSVGEVTSLYIGNGMLKTPNGGVVDLDPSMITAISMEPPKVMPEPELSTAETIAAKAEALMQGREYVIPEDVDKVVYPVLRFESEWVHSRQHRKNSCPAIAIPAEPEPIHQQ